MWEIISTFIGMAFGAGFVLLSTVPILVLLDKVWEKCALYVTEGDYNGETFVRNKLEQITIWCIDENDARATFFIIFTIMFTICTFCVYIVEIFGHGKSFFDLSSLSVFFNKFKSLNTFLK